MSSEPRHTFSDPSSLSGLRTFIVPPDIIAVRRQSPIPVKKRTPCRPKPDGELTERAGSREWFSDGLFVAPPERHTGSGYGTSAAVHISCVVLILVGLLTRSVPIPSIKEGASLVIPVLVAPVPVVETPSPALPEALAPTPPKQLAPIPVKKVSPPKAKRQSPLTATALAAVSQPLAPIEAPSGITPETGAETGTPAPIADGSPNGVPGGVGEGIDHGLAGGRAVTPAPKAGPPSPMRLERGTQGPRRIKEVKPVYPALALSQQTRGTVIIEATIGSDGKVQAATVLRSIPLLDQAALDAVRQWEYEPMLLNGVRVAVIMPILVHFAIY